LILAPLEGGAGAAGPDFGKEADMIHTGLSLMLLLFGLIGFAGAGAAFAVARQRYAIEFEHDLGMLGVAGMLAAFAVLCAGVASGVLGVLAFGGVSTWVSYVVTAQRVGLFRLETGRLEEARAEETPRI
jgi:hypothetical protein